MSSLRTFEQARVAGIILAPLDSAIIEQSAATLTTTTPLVLANYESRRLAYSGVVTDEQRGGYLAARHLLDLGHRRLTFVGGPLMLRAVEQRYAGARQAVAEVESASLLHVETVGVNIISGRQAGRELLASQNAPDAIVAASDLIAIGIMQVFEQADVYDVPGEIAVIGYDNNHFAAESRVPLSTISQPGEEMGSAAAELLLREIWGTAPAKKQTVTLPPRLIARRSTLGDAWRRD